MRLSDFIAKRLHLLGCEKVYMVTGGAAMHLNDAFTQEYVDNVHFLHHEQSCSMAAESYSRVTGKCAIVNVTAGPGSINAINGIFGAYTDSLPIFIISGQSKKETLATTYSVTGLRQLGDQEVDIVRMVSGICKKAVQLLNPLDVSLIINELYTLATSGRPGPVWLDIPIDVQASILPTDFCANTQLCNDISNLPSTISTTPHFTDSQILTIAKALLATSRPILYAGSGIRISKSYNEFLDFLVRWRIPTVTGWNSNDLLWDDHESYCGRPGTIGNRTGNFAVQYSQCLLVAGSRLNLRQLSYNWTSFAPTAYKIQVDIDQAELDKPTLHTDLKVNSCLSGFFPALDAALSNLSSQPKLVDSNSLWEPWRNWLKKKLKEYSVLNEIRLDNSQDINPYRFVDRLTRKLNENEIIVCSDGTACVAGFQAAIIKKNQRMYHNSGCASMGYELPASIGAFHATNNRVICLAGDGSIMMNLQELTIIGSTKMPILIYILNNQGYHSIRQTQLNYFPNNPVGCGPDSGLPFPSFKKIANAFDFKYFYSQFDHCLDFDISESLKSSEPTIHEIKLNLKQGFNPKVSSRKLDDGTMISSELDDMFPFLDATDLQFIRDEAHSL